MDQAELEYLNNIESKYKEERLMNINQSNNHLATTLINGNNNENLIRYQLENQKELEEFERLLRGHILRRDSKGNEYWEEPPQDEQLFNDKGVREIMKRLSTYLFKSILLSNYTVEQIDQRCKQFGHSITDFIYLSAEEFGLDSEEKYNHFEMVVMDIINLVESAYLRALNGEERESLRSARLVTQTEGLNQNNGIQNLKSSSQNKFSFFKPTTWLK